MALLTTHQNIKQIPIALTLSAVLKIDMESKIDIETVLNFPVKRGLGFRGLGFRGVGASGLGV